MAQYRKKVVPTVEAFPTPDGNYVVIESGIAKPVLKTDFEREYEPVPLPQG